MARKIQVEILGDSKSLEAALGRSQQKTSNFGKALSVGAKVGAGALLGLAFAAKKGFDELNDIAKANQQTAAVLKSTGGAAGVTAGHVRKLSTNLQSLSGVDDQTVQSMENMLLTFRNIQNTAGRTNDVFDQATKATLDLSVALGEDTKSAAIQVGKALNDPIHGLTSLQRVGVQFTDSQKALIKKLVETGNTAEAQKLILGELNQEFGGSAEAAGKTLPAQLAKLSDAFAGVAANLVQALLPSVQLLIGYMSSLAGWMQQNQQTTKILVVAVAALSAGVIVLNAAYKAWAAITPVLTAAQWALNAALAGNPVVLVTAAVIALGIALVIAYKKSETFRNIVSGAIDFVKNHWQILVALIPGIGPVLVLAATHFKTLRNIAEAVFDFIKGKVQSVINVVKSLWGWIQTVASALQSLWDKAKSVANFVGGIANIGGPTGADRRRGVTGTPGHPGVAGVTHVHVYLDGKEIHSSVQRQDRVYRRQNGRSAFA